MAGVYAHGLTMPGRPSERLLLAPVIALLACAGPAPRGATPNHAGQGQRPATTRTDRAIPAGGFASPLGKRHPLAGAIVRATDGAEVSWAQLVAELVTARAVLLGEKHDNPDHHRLQARIYAALSDGQPPPAAVFEMLDAGDQPAVTALWKRADRTPDQLAAAVDWEASGWPPFPLYAPIFSQVMGAGAPVLAAGLPRALAMQLARGQPLMPVGAFEGGLEVRYGIDRPLPEAQHAAVRTLMVDAHCGMLPEGMLDGMVRIQRLRDGLMAEGIRLGIEQQGRAVLFAGAGHVRRDRAVPALLARVGITDALSVGFLEVTAGRVAVADYLDADRRAGFDFLVLTPALPAEDHCAELRKRFGGSHGGHGAGEPAGE